MFICILFNLVIHRQKIQFINYDKFKELYDSKRSFYLIISSNECKACKIYINDLNENLDKYNLKIYALIVEGLDSDQINLLKEEFNVKQVPTTLFFERGDLKNNKVLLDGHDFVEFINDFERR